MVWAVRRSRQRVLGPQVAAVAVQGFGLGLCVAGVGCGEDSATVMLQVLP